MKWIFYFLETKSLWERLISGISWIRYFVFSFHERVPLYSEYHPSSWGSGSYGMSVNVSVYWNMISNGDAFSWMCLTFWYSCITLCSMGEVLFIVSKRFLAWQIRCCRIGREPVQSWRSLIAMYLGLFITTLNAWFWTNCNLSKWTSAAFTKHIEPYSKIGRKIEL